MPCPRWGARPRAFPPTRPRLMATASPSTERAGGGFFTRIMDGVADVGEIVLAWVEAVGAIVMFAGQTLSWLFTRVPRRDTLILALYQIGVRSLPVVALTGTF